MSDAPPEHDPAQVPVEPLYTHPASPFMRTESNIPPQVAQIAGSVISSFQLPDLTPVHSGRGEVFV